MKIGIDLDSTIAKVDSPWLDRLNKACGTNYTSQQWTDWNLTFLKPQERKILFEVFTPDLYEIVQPYGGAPEVVKELATTPGVELECVTANPSLNSQEFAEAKKRWLRCHFPDLANSVVFSKKKSGLGLDVLIDDAPQHFETGDFIPVLVERPWNTMVRCELHFREWNQARSVLFPLLTQWRRELTPDQV